MKRVDMRLARMERLRRGLVATVDAEIAGLLAEEWRHRGGRGDPPAAELDALAREILAEADA